MAGGVEVAGLVVDAEGDDGVGVLVGGQEPGAGGVDGEVARGLALGGLVAKAGEAAGGLVDGEHVGINIIDLTRRFGEAG